MARAAPSAALSTVCLGALPTCLAASDCGTLSPQPATAQASTATIRTRITPSLARRGLVAGLVDQLVLLDPGHHGAQLLAHHLDRVLGVQAAARLQGRGAGAVLDDEALGVFAGLDVLQHLLHHLLGLVGDDARAGDVLAVLRV